MRFGHTSPDNNLDIFDVIRRSFIFLWQNRNSFINLCFPAIVILSILSTVLSIVFVEPENLGLNSSPGPVVVSFDMLLPIFLSLPVVVFFIICFSVGWHRFYLIPNDFCDLKESLLWKKRHSRYLYSTITIFMLVIMIGMFGLLFTALGPIGILITLVLIIAFYSRLAFVLPVLAIDKDFNFFNSWNITKGNTIKISLVIFFIWFLTISATIFLGQIIQSVFQPNLSFMGIFVISFVFRSLSFISLALIVTALSIIYIELSKISHNSLNET